MTKGWCSVKPYRCRSTHYVNPSNGSRSMCGRSPIRITAEGVFAMRIELRRKFANLTICDWCEHRRYHSKRKEA